MRVVGKEKVDDYVKRYSECRRAVMSLILEIESAEWNTPHDITAHYPKASIIGNTNVVFNICGNKYRLWLKITYKTGIVIIKNIGTHKEYDRWEIE